MDKYIYDDKNGLWYELQGDYYDPCTTLLTSGRLNACLADVDKQVQERMERLTEQMKRAQGITEQLKAENGFGMDTKNEYHTSICKGNCRKENHFCIGTERRQGEISVAY